MTSLQLDITWADAQLRADHPVKQRSKPLALEEAQQNAMVITLLALGAQRQFPARWHLTQSALTSPITFS